MSFIPSVEGIGTLLKNQLLAVPEYQRPYSWELEDVADLWRDLSAALTAGAPEYFLGSVVTTLTATNRLSVIDGQQRLATVSLLYAGLVDLFEARADERAAQIRQTFLGERDIISRALQQRLELNAEDNDLFRNLTLRPLAERTIAAPRESHRLLLGAFDYLKNQLAGLTTGLGADDWQAPLLRWYQFLTDRAKVLRLTVEDEGRAFVIFETLNDRGVNLNAADLLRNHLLGTAGPRIAEVKQRWTRAVAMVSAEGASEQIETFLRHYWASEQGVVRVKALYSHVKPSITSPDSAVDFAKRLEETSPLWSAIFNRDADLWSSYPAKIQDALEVLRRLNVEQCRPLLLATLRRFSPPQVADVFRMVVNWSVRWIVTGGGSAGTVEKLYADAARKVTERTIADTAGLLAHFEGSLPSDLSFETAFANKAINSGWQARYYLRVLERARRAETEPELVPNQDVEEVNLEHVLPKNPVSEWNAAFSSEEAEALVLLLGNQALLKKDHNRRIGNKPFTVKRPILAASSFELTREIGAEPDWTPEKIRERAAQLAALAVQVWTKS
jgi:hypothetical protein